MINGTSRHEAFFLKVLKSALLKNDNIFKNWLCVAIFPIHSVIGFYQNLVKNFTEYIYQGKFYQSKKKDIPLKKIILVKKTNYGPS